MHILAMTYGLSVGGVLMKEVMMIAHVSIRYALHTKQNTTDTIHCHNPYDCSMDAVQHVLHTLSKGMLTEYLHYYFFFLLSLMLMS